MEAIRNQIINALIFIVAAIVAAVWIAGFSLVVLTELAKNAWS